jgi:hypothetical protein
MSQKKKKSKGSEKSVTKKHLKISTIEPEKEIIEKKNLKISAKEIIEIPEKRFEYKGKYYKVGSIIPISSDLKFQKVRTGPSRKRNALLYKIPGAIDIEAEEKYEKEEEIPEEYVEEESGEEEIKEKSQKKKVKKDDEESGEEREIASEESDIESEEESIDEPENIGKGEDIVDFEEVSVPLFTGRLAKSMGFEDKKIILKPKTTPNPQINRVLKYEDYDLYIVIEDKDGNLKLRPYVSTDIKKVKIIDGDFLPPPSSQDYTPSKSTFTREPGRKYVQIKFDENAEHYLDLPVKESTRDDIAKMLFHKLADIIPDIYDLEDEPARLLELNKKVDWNILKYSIKKWEKDGTWKKERELFFKKEFEKWFQQKNYAKYLAKAPDFSEKSKLEHDKMLNSSLVVEGLLETFGDDIFNENGSYLLQKMENKMKSKKFIPSYIDVIIQKELLKIGDEHLSKFSGTSLAMEVANIISNFFKYYKQPSIQQISDRLKSEWIEKKLKKIESTEKDHKKFEKENGSKIEQDFINFKNKWITARKNADLYKKERDLLSESRHKRGIEQSKITIKTENGKHLTNRGIRLANEVIELELKIYVEHGQTENSGTNMTYLQNILNILMFLDKEDSVGKYANYFRAKIANNFYNVGELNSLTYLQMFPEFFVNSKLTKEEYNAGLKRLEKEVLNRIIAYINLWMLNKVEKKEIVLFTKEKFQWENYITKISQSCGGFRIKGGKNTLYKGVETSENYDCNLVDENNFVCAAKIEEIPDDDLIISYDKKQDKFICFSLTDVLYALKEQDKTKKTPINYITMQKYDEDFLKRMRVRYLDLLKQDFPERTITFHSTFNELLFGEKDEKEIEIPTKEKKTKKSTKSSKKSVKKSTKKTALSKALESEWY